MMFQFDPNNFQLEDLDRIVDQSEEALRSLERLQDELAEVVGTGSSPDGLIEAKVNGSGGIQGVTINPRALRLDSQRLGEAVTQAVGAAQEDAQRRMAEVMQPVLGTGPLDQERLREQFRDIKEGFAFRMEEREERAQRRAWDR